MGSKPQVENGYTRIADELLEALIKIRIPGQAMQVLLFIIRKTYGFNKKQDAISLSQFEAGTGLSKPRICHCLDKLSEINIITKNGNMATTKYSINKHYSTWKPLPKKETIAKKGNKSCQKRKSPLPNMGHTIDTLTKDSIKREGKLELFISHLDDPHKNNNELLDSIKEWLAYRRERKLTMTPRTLKGQANKLMKFTPDQGITAIRDSIDSGYQGLFPNQKPPKRNFI